jgi:hypothetical protein
MADDGSKILNIIRSLRGEIKGLKEDLKDVDKLLPTGGGGKSPTSGANASTSKTPPYPTAPSAPSPPSTTPPPTVTPGNVGANGGRGGYSWGTTLAGLTGKGIAGAAKGALEVAIAAASFLPTGQEAVGVQQLSDRIKFYGNSNGRNIQRYAAQTGISTSPLDAAYASNAAFDVGLLPGLKNYGGGLNKNNPFTGVMGSAALASNLSPGLGITGGVGVVGAINAPQNVNMLRAFGINARPNGDKTADLASIIDQLYDILSSSHEVTKEYIAISAMPGNALDSILNQYFGGDPNVKSVIISGLIQKASGLKTKKGKILSLYQSGNQANLMNTGGLSSGNVSIARRNASELGMISNNTKSAVEGVVGANNGLQSLYDFMGSTSGNSFVNGGQKLGIALETLGGARNGAGAQLMNTLLANSGLTGVTALGTYLYDKGFTGAKNLFGSVSSLKNPRNLLEGFGQGLTNFGTSPQAVSGGSYSGTAAVGSGNTFTGGININLQLLPGQDPYSVGSALTQQMQWGLFS